MASSITSGMHISILRIKESFVKQISAFITLWSDYVIVGFNNVKWLEIEISVSYFTDLHNLMKQADIIDENKKLKGEEENFILNLNVFFSVFFDVS